MKNLENDKRRNAYFALESTWTFLSVDHKWFFYIFQMMLLLIYFLKKFDAFHLLYFTLKMARSTWGKEICIVFVFYSCVKLNFCCTGGGWGHTSTSHTLPLEIPNKTRRDFDKLNKILLHILDILTPTTKTQTPGNSTWNF